MVAGAVDRLELAPGRLRFLFGFDAGRVATERALADELAVEPARAVVTALAEALAAGPRMVDREAFRGVAARVRERTRQKGRALFHPMRVALTGESDGPELDLAVPAIERGTLLAHGSGVAPVQGCRERAAAVAVALGEVPRGGGR
jgi:glutamyl/glutaminyl-tRNA synthetase